MRAQRLIRLDHGKHWSHDISGERPVGIDRAHDLGSLRLQPQFFPRLAQGGGNRILAGIDAPSGKSHLARVGAHMLAANGQDHAGFGPGGDPDEDCRRNGVQCLLVGKIGFEWRRGGLMRQCIAQSIGEGHSESSTSGKNVPPLQTPGGSPPSSSAISASS